MVKGEGAEQKSLLVPRHCPPVLLTRLGQVCYIAQINFHSVLPDCRKTIALWEVFGLHPSVPRYSHVSMKISVARCWNDILWRKRKYSDRNLSKCQHKSHMPQTDVVSNPGLRGERPTTNRLSRGASKLLLVILMNRNIQNLPLLLLFDYQSLG